MSHQSNMFKLFCNYIKSSPTADYKESLDFALSKLTKYNTFTECLQDIVNKSSDSNFLLKECGIDFDAIFDNGSAIGLEANGTFSYTDTSIMPETGNITYPATNSTVIFGNLSVVFPSSFQTTAQRYLMGCLRTWWVKNSLDRIENVLGWSFGDSDAKIKTVQLVWQSGNDLNYIIKAEGQYSSTDKKIPTNIYIYFNQNIIDKIVTTDTHGSYPDYYVNFDLIFLRELTKALLISKRYYTETLPVWFLAGIGETVRGAKDLSSVSIEYFNDKSNSLIVDYAKTKQEDYKNLDYPNLLGFIFFRFLMKQTEKAPQFTDYGKSLCQRGKVYSLYELGKHFLEFAQKSGTSIQAWELVNDRLSTFYGSTLKIPRNDIARKLDNGELYTPCFYASLQFSDIRENTYTEWATDIRESLPWDTKNTSYLADMINRTGIKGNSTRAVRFTNNFIDNGSFLAIGLHTLYDDDLFMCEQGGVTCEPEESIQTNGLNLPELPVIITPQSGGNPSYDTSENSPIFPGTGCPWLTLSDININEFDVENVGIQYWFTKQDYNATITFKVGYKEEDIYWQSISFGCLDIIDNDSYLMPLYVGGGTQGIKNYLFIIPPIGSARCNTYVNTNKYSLDIKNFSLANCNILYPTLFNSSKTTNLKIKLPDGEWVSVANNTQYADLKSPFYCSSPQCITYYSVINEPLKGVHTSNYPFLSTIKNNVNMIDTYVVNDPLDFHKSGAPLDSVFIISSKSDHPYENGIQGFIPNIKSGWSKSLTSGEMEIDGHKYLCVPNCWENRTWYYPYIIGNVVYTNEQIKSLIDNMFDYYAGNVFKNKLLISLDGE